MAYTNSPEMQTYKTVAIPFNGEDQYRTGDLSVQRDLQIVNMYYDRISQENQRRATNLRKRAGIAQTGYSLSKVSSNATLRGYFYDNDQNAFYWATGNKVYAIKPDVGTSVRTVCTLTTSTGYVGFCSYLKSDNTRYIMIADGTDLWYDNYVTTTCTSITHTGNFPTPHQPYPVYLDGYIFLIKADTGDIYNCEVDDVTVWSGDPISAEISSDWGIRLFKVKNYLVCLGYNSIEYFWDAGNEAPSSPLSRNDSPVRNVGYIAGGCQSGDNVYFVGQDEKQNVAIYMINSFKTEKISNPVVDRTLQALGSTNNVKSQVYLGVDGHIVSVDGHSFYVLVTPQTTWVYELNDKIWYEWKGSDGTGLKIEACWGMFRGACYLGITGQSNISIMSPSLYQDFGSNFTCRYTTDNMTFETMNWKICNRVSLSCSKHLNSGTSNVVLTYSPDDWSSTGLVGTRYINVFSNSPFTSRLGKFRNMSFRIEYTDNYPFFMDKLEIDINVYGV